MEFLPKKRDFCIFIWCRNGLEAFEEKKRTYFIPMNPSRMNCLKEERCPVLGGFFRALSHSCTYLNIWNRKTSFQAHPGFHFSWFLPGRTKFPHAYLLNVISTSPAKIMLSNLLWRIRDLSLDFVQTACGLLQPGLFEDPKHWKDHGVLPPHLPLLIQNIQ